MYALTPLHSIRGRLNFISTGEHTKPLHNNFPYKNKIIDLVCDTKNWETQLFYVNPFKRDGDATFDTNSATRESFNAIQNGEGSVYINLTLTYALRN